eukprot:TRINITY_DN24593_c0_g1_i1.p1 TRINITY_DN24593_c0_g1~~TRINITY_DN24593_c0_g1_i1.p1  ORF type:complete len:228 (+),score=52.21 TRINITY_DN24593_c0_g1_i1:197-880(+)
MSRWAKKNVFHRVTELLKSPNVTKPGWYDAAMLVPPPRKNFNVPKPKRMVYKEDRLLSTFEQRVGDNSYQYLHLPGANKSGPAVAFVRRQLELMEAKNLSERQAFREVMAEAESSATIADAAMFLASQEDVLSPMTEREMEETVDHHVKNIATNVAESWVVDTMANEGISRQDAEAKALKHMKFESRNLYERLRKIYSPTQYSNNQNQPTMVRTRDPRTIRAPPKRR